MADGPAPNADGHKGPDNSKYQSWYEMIDGLVAVLIPKMFSRSSSEAPRKLLHSSIGFMVLYFYCNDYTSSSVANVLLGLLLIIFPTDVLRFSWPWFNRLYQSVLGFLMRDSERHMNYNGVIWYLLGCWVVLTFFPKDIASIAIVLLSWCDTAAAIIGRRFGHLTPKFSHGKSLAGFAAAVSVGIGVSFFFWEYIQPFVEGRKDILSTYKPPSWTPESTHLGLVNLSILTGLVAGISELIGGVAGLDDNTTLPILCGFLLHLFLNVLGWGK